MALTGKVGVVAGGATGIGATTAARKAQEGCLVVVGDLADETAHRTADIFVAGGGTATAVGFDLAEPDSTAALLDAAAAYGGIDAVFAVGADMGTISADTNVVDIDVNVWDRVMQVNLRGYVATTKYAIPHMLTRGGGLIVNLSSAAAFQGEPTRPAYATAQGRNRRADEARRLTVGREGIRCNAVAPGFTATESIQCAPQWPELQTAALRRIGAPRVGAPDDGAALVSFPVSQEGEWINGQVINIDDVTVLR